MKIIGTVFRILFVGLLFAIGILLVGTLLPLPGNYSVKIVRSGSMEPAILTGALVIVKPVPDYVVGDVITFGQERAGKLPTTHRIVEIGTSNSGPRYFTKGDANDNRDQETVAKRDIIGKVLFSVPYAGFVLSFAREPLGFFLLIVVPAGLIVIDEIFVIVGEVRARRKRQHTV